MALAEKDLTADGYLSRLLENPSVTGYVVFNSDGIPMRYDGQGITHRIAVHYTALVSDFLLVTKKIIQKQLKDSFSSLGRGTQTGNPGNAENEIEHVRIRTEKHTELIVTFSGEFTMVCIQKCCKDSLEKEKGDEKEKAKKLPSA